MSKTHGGKIVDGSCLCNLQEDLLETKYSSSFLYGDPRANPGKVPPLNPVGDTRAIGGIAKVPFQGSCTSSYLLYVTLNSPEIIFLDMT